MNIDNKPVRIRIKYQRPGETKEPADGGKLNPNKYKFYSNII